VIGPDEKPVRFEGEFEVGRPPGTPAGEDLTNPIVLRFARLPLSPGAYRFDFEVDGTTLATARFRMLSMEG
jgi:hypothetical protein